MNARFFGSGSQTLVEERCIEPKVATMKGKQDASLMITQMLHVGNIYLHFPLDVAIFYLSCR